MKDLLHVFSFLTYSFSSISTTKILTFLTSIAKHVFKFDFLYYFKLVVITQINDILPMKTQVLFQISSEILRFYWA